METVRADNQRLHNELGNLQKREERELTQVRSQLETERASREEIEAQLSPAKEKFCSGRHTFGEINTRRGHNS